MRDGLEIAGSDHVAVKGGLIRSLYDAIRIKDTNYSPDGGARGHPVTDLSFNAILKMNTGAGAALAVGTELHTDMVSGIIFRNIAVLHAIAPQGTVISVRNGDRAEVRNILLDHMTVLNRSGTLVRLSVETDGYKSDEQRGNM